MHRLHEVRGVAILAPQVDPVLRPDAQLVEHRLELPARGGRVVLPAPAGPVRMALDDAGLLECPQARREQALADAPHAVLDLAEVVPVEQHDLAEDERRPALGNDLAREGNRVDLLIFHGPSINLRGALGSAEIARTTPIVALASGRTRPHRRDTSG